MTGNLYGPLTETNRAASVEIVPVPNHFVKDD
jgi:hypothetical protein